MSEGTSRAVDGFVAADAVGHRVVHGGPRYEIPARIDDDVEQAIEEMTALAPLQNAGTLDAIRAARAALPGVPQVAVFDTGFHRTIPPAAATYDSREKFGTLDAIDRALNKSELTYTSSD